MPLALTDDQLDAVLAAAKPLPVGDRDAFLKAVAGFQRPGEEVRNEAARIPIGS